MATLSKMTKVELIQLITMKDSELLALRSAVSQLQGDRQNRTAVDAINAVGEPTSVLMHRARELAQATGVSHRVHQGRIESYDRELRTWI